MRFTRWSAFIFACVYSIIGFGMLASGESSNFIRLVEEVGAMYINEPLVGFLVMSLGLSALGALIASWVSGRSGAQSQELNRMRWGVGFTAATTIAFGIYGMALISSANQARCGDFFGGMQCRRVQDGVAASGRVALIVAAVTLIYLVIVLLVSHLGSQKTPIVVQPTPPPPQPRPVEGDLPTQLERLGEMRKKGDLTDQEFDAAKRRLLGKTDE